MAAAVSGRKAWGSGPLFRLYQIVWLAALALAIVGTGLGLYHTRHFYEDFYVAPGALGLSFRGNAPLDDIRLNRPADDPAGPGEIQDGDVILAIDGQPAHRGVLRMNKLNQALGAAPGPVVMIRTRSVDGAVRDHALRRDPARVDARYAGTGFSAWSMLLIQHALTLSGAIALTLAAALLFGRRSRDPVAALLSLSFLLLALLFGPSGAATPYVPSLNAAINLLWGFGAGGFFIALLLFPAGRFGSPWTRLAAGLAVTFALAGDLGNFGVLNLPQMPMNAVAGVLFVLGVLAQVVRYRRLPPGPQRQQIRWALFGFTAAAFFYLLGLLCQILVPVAANARQGVWLLFLLIATFNLSLLLMAGGLLISLLRYRLYDAEAVISRSAAYAVLTLGLVAVWAGAEKAIEVIFEGQFGHEAGAMSAGIAAGLAALLVTPAHNRVHHWTEKVFQKALVHLRQDLPLCVGDLRETASLKGLLEVVLDRIKPGVRASHAVVVLREGRGLKAAASQDIAPKKLAAWLKGFHGAAEGTALSRDAGDVLFPLRLPLVVNHDGPARTIGWILLGPRPDGSFYGRDELDTLRTIADPVARAIHIARQREAGEAARRAEMAALRAEIAALRAVVVVAGKA